VEFNAARSIPSLGIGGKLLRQFYEACPNLEIRLIRVLGHQGTRARGLGAWDMNQTIRTGRRLHSSIHQRRIESSEWSARAAPRIRFEKHPRKTLLGKLTRVVIVVAVFAFLIVAAVVIRLAAF